jgi:hypothetical protein
MTLQAQRDDSGWCFVRHVRHRGGGSMIALCAENPERVVNAVQEASYQAIEVTIG